MKTDRRYSIEFRGLKEGIHIFNFDIDDTFFEGLEYSEVTKGKLEARVNMAKRSTLLDIDIYLEGSVVLYCDRCLDEYFQDIQYTGKLIAKYTGGENTSDDEVLSIPESENQIDLKQYLYESIALTLPYKRVHPSKSDCNKEMIKKLNKLTPKHENEIDPRWDKLKNMSSK